MNYKTIGLDRVLLRNINHTKVFKATNLFTIFGVANGIGYGLSHFMSKENYAYYFGYKGDGRISNMFRSFMGSNTLANAVWTVPSLLVLG